MAVGEETIRVSGLWTGSVVFQQGRDVTGVVLGEDEAGVGCEDCMEGREPRKGTPPRKAVIVDSHLAGNKGLRVGRGAVTGRRRGRMGRRSRGEFRRT